MNTTLCRDLGVSLTASIKSYMILIHPVHHVMSAGGTVLPHHWISPPHWGHLKSVLYDVCLQSTAALQDSIYAACTLIAPVTTATCEI
jgi:hypothetical protein